MQDIAEYLLWVFWQKQTVGDIQSETLSLHEHLLCLCHIHIKPSTKGTHIEGDFFFPQLTENQPVYRPFYIKSNFKGN